MNPYIVLDIETTGLSPFKNQITCICAKTNNNEFFKKVSKDEIKILLDFRAWLIKLNVKDNTLFVGHATETFDLPFIILRALQYEIPIHIDFNIFDTKLESEFLREQGVWLSLNNLAKILGLPGQKTGNGLEAIKLFNEGKYDELVSYCWQDVLLTEQVYLKLLEKKAEVEE